MAYERDDRRYGNSGDRDYGQGAGDRSRGSYGGQGYDRDQSSGHYGSDEARNAYGQRGYDQGSQRQGGAGQGGYGRGSQGRGDQDRGFIDRAGDEVRSWFGDEDAERRRQQDERSDRYANRGYDQQGYGYQGASQNYGQGSGGQSAGGQSSGQGYRSRHEHDPHFRSWRDRQMESLDKDYDEYRNEHQTRFDSEFGSWRQNRQGQRDSLTKVQEHQEVVGSDGQHIGTVDHVRGDRILLTKNDQAAGGHHYSIPSSWVQSVDDKVTVSKTADQAKQHWRDEERNSDGGMFGGGNSSGQNNLNRSFSGTY